MPWESGGTSLPRRAFPGPGTTHTLGLTPSLMPWEHPTPSKAHHCPRSFRLAPHAILFKTLQAKETWIHSLPTSAFPSLGRREAWIGWPQKGQNVPKSPRFLNKTKHGHGNAVVGGGAGEARTEHSQPVGPRAGEQSPREPRPPPLNKHHMATEHKSTFLNLPRRGAKGKKKKSEESGQRERK